MGAGSRFCSIEHFYMLMNNSGYITIQHEISKKHYISFIAAVKDDGYEIKELYAEGNAEARFKINRTKYFLYYCNMHGLFKVPVR